MLFLLDKIIRYILYYIYLVRSYGIAFNLELLLHEMYTCTPKYISLHMISFENVVDLVCVPIAKSHVLHKHTHTFTLHSPKTDSAAYLLLQHWVPTSHYRSKRQTMPSWRWRVRWRNGLRNCQE